MSNHIFHKNKNKLLYISGISLIIIFFLTFMSITFKEDEEVTMGFMEHNLHSIIYIDSLDVHPPLYYLLLKIFLVIFTFWTKSFFIKTLFARLFSLICFMLIIYFLTKIVKLSNIHLDIQYKTFLISLICLMPSVLEVATHLRMYELTALFIIIEYYKLIEFNRSNRSLYLLYATIFAILAAYTHYFIAIIAGLLLVIFCIKELRTKCIKQSVYIFTAGVILIVSYIPMIPYVLSQFINRSKFAPSNNNMYDQTISSLVQLTAAGNKMKDVFDFILFISLIIVTFILIKINDNKLLIERLYDIGVCVILSIIIELFISLIYSPFYECRFIFPLVLMYFFFLISLFVDTIQKYGFNIYEWLGGVGMFFSVICMLFIGLYDCNKLNQNIKQYDKPSIQLIDSMKQYKKTNKKNINVTLKHHYPTQFQEALYATQNAVYLRSINKNAVIVNPQKTNFYSECNGNKKFVSELFTNLHTK